jgi:transposase
VSEIITIGLDLAKNVFQVHGADASGQAVLRPTMRFVPVKSEKTSGAAMVLRLRQLLIGQRTQAINTLRGHLSEFGQILPQGAAHASKLIAIIDDPECRLPADAIPTLTVLVAALAQLKAEIAKFDAEITRRAKGNDVARRLMTVPGIGPTAFNRGRAAAWGGNCKACSKRAAIPGQQSPDCGQRHLDRVHLEPDSDLRR